MQHCIGFGCLLRLLEVHLALAHGAQALDGVSDDVHRVSLEAKIVLPGAAAMLT